MNQPTASSERSGPGRSSGLLPLNCRVQHYAWGDSRFIPALLGIDNPQAKPFAELWMGAHPDLPSEVVLADGSVGLDELIDADPQAMLGAQVAAEFQGRLPYLLKILSAASPLSIQVHPAKASAEEGFTRENQAGVPVSAPSRSYRDDNHKPELIAALTDFRCLRGFRPLLEIGLTLARVPEFHDLASDFERTSESLRSLYEQFMNWPQHRVDALLDPLVRRLEREQSETERPFTADDRRHWVLRADREYSTDGHRDRGLFSIYLLNFIRLRPGQAIQLPAGVLHAYLEGSGVEIMANSNNVIRGGLTPKHVDVPELLQNVTFEAGPAEILYAAPLSDTESAYPTSFREFELRRIEVGEDRSHQNGGDHSAEILLCVSADQPAGVTLASDEQSLTVAGGGTVFVRQGVAYTIEARGSATLFKATVPMPTAADQTAADGTDDSLNTTGMPR